MKFCLSIFLTLVFAVTGLPSQGLTTPVIYKALLSGASEEPPNLSPGTGSATVVLDTDAHTLFVQAKFSDLQGITTAAHIHGPTAVPGTGNAAVITTTPTFPGFPLGVTAGNYDQLFFDIDINPSSWNPAFITAHGESPADAEDAFAVILAAGTAYFNIHSNLYPAGEIRGFLIAPAPATMLLFGTGLAGLAGIRLRRKKP
jgi:hypothetical protein